MRFSNKNKSVEEKGAGPSGNNDVMFVKEDDPVVEDNTVAAFTRAASGETITKQQRMQNDIEAYNRIQVKPNVTVRANPDFPVPRKAGKKNKKSGKKSASKMVIAEMGKRVEKYDLISSLAQVQAGVIYVHIARGDIDFAKTELQRILDRKTGRSVVNLAGKDEVHEVSLSRHLLVRVEVYSEPTLDLFESGAIPNVISPKMVKKLHLRMKPTNRAIKVANCVSEKCVGTLKEVPISMAIW